VVCGGAIDGTTPVWGGKGGGGIFDRMCGVLQEVLGTHRAQKRQAVHGGVKEISRVLSRGAVRAKQ